MGLPRRYHLKCTMCGMVGNTFFGGLLAALAVLKAVSLLLTVAAMCRNARLTLRLLAGRYRIDRQRRGHGWLQLLTRYVWEAPQVELGYWISLCRVLMGDVDRVDYHGGVTFVTRQAAPNAWGGMSLGCFVNISTTRRVDDFPVWMKPAKGISLPMHEMGHTFDSQRLGPFYLLVVGIPSLWSASRKKASWRHNDFYPERWADRNALRYFVGRNNDLS